VAVSWLTADTNSRYSFTCDVPGVVVDFGAGAEALYANEVPGMAIAAGGVTSAQVDARMKWAPTTAYTLGQQILSPNSDVVKANVAHTSAAAFATDVAKWDLSATFAPASGSTSYLPGVAAIGAGIDPTGAADSTAAIQAKIDAVGVAGGIVYVPTGTYSVTGLLLPSGVTLQGGNSGGQVGGPSKLVYAGAAGGTCIGPKVRTSDTINVGIIGLSVDGGGLAAIGIDMYRTSYSRLRDGAVFGMQAGGVGVLFDANVSNQCYFNTADGMKCDGVATGVRFQNGANANRWEGGKIGNGGTGMEFLSLSAGNVIIGTDLETASVKHIYLDAPANVFIGLHMEVAPIGYDITANGGGTRRIGTTFASTVTTYVSDLSTTGNVLDTLTTDTDKLQIGSTSVTSKMLSTTTQVDADPRTLNGTASAIWNFFRNITTSGIKQINFYKGDGTSSKAFIFDLATGDFTTLSGKVINGSWGFTDTIGLGAPTTGAQVVGSRVRNRTPAVGSPKAWVCTVAGTPGTWVSEGNL
jgi:hypothetical protein